MADMRALLAEAQIEIDALIRRTGDKIDSRFRRGGRAPAHFKRLEALRDLSARITAALAEAEPGDAMALPLRMEVSAGGVLSVMIGAATLSWVAEHSPNFDDVAGSRLKVIDGVKFAREVACALNDEAEDGSTLVTRILDAAILAAVENGAEGIELADEDRIERAADRPGGGEG